MKATRSCRHGWPEVQEVKRSRLRSGTCRCRAGNVQAEVRLFSAKKYETTRFEQANEQAGSKFKMTFIDVPLSLDTVGIADTAEVVCVFVNDIVDKPVLQKLADSGTRCIALRCAGYNNVDLAAAAELGLPVVHVPSYSPNAVAEHTIALILALNRNIPRAYNRVRDNNFALHGLVGFDMKGKTAAVIGTGRIGSIVARLLWHLRCNVVAFDRYHDEHLVELGVEYTQNMEEALVQGDIITLNCPLLDSTKHLIGPNMIPKLKHGVMVVNTGRGPLVDTEAAIQGLKSGQIGSMALDVYEEEANLFFEDHSEEIPQDDKFARLMSFPNVLVTAHQGFLTHEALSAIAETTLENIATVLDGEKCDNEVKAQ